MRILFLGDIMGSAGRRVICQHLPDLRKKWRADFTILNAENATHGRGLSPSHAQILFEAGADCITLGDHAFDQKAMCNFIADEPRIIRPLNLGSEALGRGAQVFSLDDGRRILVTQILGTVFMKLSVSNPFKAIAQVLKAHKCPDNVSASLVDFHAEATSEKMAMGHWCDGRASVVVGTHTHVPTADTVILPKGTAYQSDAGMCGDYNSVIGMQAGEPVSRFVTGTRNAPFSPATGQATIAGLFVETDDKTGKAIQTHPIRSYGVLGTT